MQALADRTGNEEKIGETALAYFSQCPFCCTDYYMNYEQSPEGRHMYCTNCRRKWSIIYTRGTTWQLRTTDPQQTKRYISSWMIQRGHGLLEGMRPYQLLEADYLKNEKQRIIEHGTDRFVWKDDPLLEHFDRYDRLRKRNSTERIKIAFACARTKLENEYETTAETGLSVKQVAAVTNIPEDEAWICTQRLLDEGLVSYEIRLEEGSSGVEPFIVGFLGEPLYQMNEQTAERTIKELIR